MDLVYSKGYCDILMVISYFPYFFFIYYLEFFCKNDWSLSFPPFIYLFTYVSVESYLGGGYSPIALFILFKLF